MKGKNIYLLRFFTLLLFIATGLSGFAQCDDDVIPPIAICVNGLQVMSSPGEGATIWAEDINESSYDDCSVVSLELVLASDDTGTPPGTASVSLPDVAGEYSMILYVTDEAGNVNTCFTSVFLLEGCTEDEEDPNIVCNQAMVVNLNPITNSATVAAQSFLDSATDNCDFDLDISVNLFSQSTGQPQGWSSITFLNVGIVQVEVWVEDDFGNTSSCLIDVTVQINEIFDCENDVFPPVAICNDNLTIVSIPGTGATVFAETIDDGSYDNCSDIDLQLVLAADDTGTPPGTGSVNLPDVAGEYPVILYAVDEAGNIGSCFSTIHLNADCGDDDEEPTIICINGITATLDPNTLTVSVAAEDLIHSSSDNCDLNLTYSINTAELSTGQPQGDDILVITDEDEVTLIVEIWAVDDFGNATFCETYILVQYGNPTCFPDATEPVAICEAQYAASWIDGVGAFVTAADIDDGSYDLCSGVSLEIVLADDDTGMPPGTDALLLPTHPGTYDVVLYATDAAGNTNSCFTEITTVDITDTCDNDTEEPTLFCITNILVTLSPVDNSAIIFAQDILQEVTDNCDSSPQLNINFSSETTGQPQNLTAIDILETGIFELELWATDDAGNFTSCLVTVTAQINPLFECDPDTTIPVMVCDDNLDVQAHPIDGVTISVEDLDEGSFDWCSAVELTLEQTSEPSSTVPTTTTVVLPPEVGMYPVILWGQDAAGNTNQCWTFVEVTGVYYVIEGQVFQDDNDNCNLDGNEADLGLGNWTVRATHLPSGQQTTTLTAADGTYEIEALNTLTGSENDFQLEIIMPDGIGASCPTSYLLEDVAELTSAVNFPVQLIEDCIYLTVDVSAPFLRRCFPNQHFVNYANYSSFPVENANITVELDPFMQILTASAPYIDLGNGLIFFDLGTLPEGASGQISLTAQLSCDAPLGATHCVKATILPFTCTPDNGFAELIVTGECDPINDEVNFTITNVGESTMISPRTHIIIEDVVMYMSGDDPLLLNAGEEISFSFPANGATWRLAIEQDESFPFGGVAAAFVEGCGGFTPGMATQFSFGNSNPNVSQDCQENIGSWDPNDKQAFPRGYGEQNYLEANTTINYLIRFQNTGTDTAFNVRVEDQLSELLDYTTIVPGASSHPYRMELKEDGLLAFHFDNIMLPDSNANQIASNGFVKFEIQQMRDNPLGSVIENTASIFFDFNEPVITNTVHHTIGDDFVMVNTQNVLLPRVKLTVAPNPLQTFTTLRLEGYLLQDGYCQVYDTHGRLVHQMTFNGQEVQLNRTELGSAGLYFYRILDQDKMLVQGKLIVE